jgi:hypothetical protein
MADSSAGVSSAARSASLAVKLLMHMPAQNLLCLAVNRTHQTHLRLSLGYIILVDADGIYP